MNCVRRVLLLTRLPLSTHYFGTLRGIQSSFGLRRISHERKEMEDDLKNNPYYEKYANKIHNLQKTSPNDFQSRVDENKKRKSKPKFGSELERGFSVVGKAKNAHEVSDLEPAKTKLLKDVMKTELVEDMRGDEISLLWQEYFKNKDCISATIPLDLYNEIYTKGKKYPTFVLPLPRGQGYEFFMCQTTGHEVHFTPLINYQAHKENAPECLTIIHYTELQDKGIVLMQGEYNKDVLDAKESQCLANQFQLYYGHNNENREKLLINFNYYPDSFKHMDLIADLETISL